MWDFFLLLKLIAPKRLLKGNLTLVFLIPDVVMPYFTIDNCKKGLEQTRFFYVLDNFDISTKLKLSAPCRSVCIPIESIRVKDIYIIYANISIVCQMY